LVFNQIPKTLWPKLTHYVHLWTSTNQNWQSHNYNHLAMEKHIYICTNSSKIVFENNFQEGNCTWRHNYNIKCFNHTLFANCKGKWFFTIKSANFPQTSFAPHHPFWKDLSKQKKSNMEELEIRDLFFAYCLSTFVFPWLLLFFWNLLYITEWFASRCFCKHVMPFVL